jgi:hypothetical protein
MLCQCTSADRMIVQTSSAHQTSAVINREAKQLHSMLRAHNLRQGTHERALWTRYVMKPSVMSLCCCVLFAFMTQEGKMARTNLLTVF